MKPKHCSLTVAIVLVVLQGLTPSAKVLAAGSASTEAATPLERVSVMDMGDRIRVEVDSGRSVAYSLWTSEAPASVVVDLPGLSKGAGLQRMDVNKPPLLQVVPTEVSQPRAGVQLAFVLTAPTKPDIHAEATKLIIDFPKAQAVAESTNLSQDQPTQAPSGTQPAVPSTEPSNARTAHPAKVMSKVEVQRGEGEATVLILGDGDFAYDVRALNQDRLIVDLANVASPLRFQILPVDHPLLKQVRIGHHSDRVRLVFDLPKPVHYSVQPGSNQLAVRLVAANGTETLEGGTTPTALKPEDRQPTAQRVPEQERVRVVKAGRVPFPERLAQIENRPALAQMAPEVKETEESSELIGQRRYVGRRISLDFQQADIQNVFRLIAEVSGFNLVIGESVKAKVTIRLINIPWDQALDILLKMNQLGKIREGNIIWIDTFANITRQQDEEAKAKEAKAKAEDLVTRVIYIRNVPAQEIQTSLQKYLSSRGSITVNQGSNALVVQDAPSRLGAFRELVDLLDIEVPQIQIEARIVQADTNYSRALGVQWGVKNSDSTNNRFSIFGNLTGPFAELAGTGSTTFQRNFIVNLPAAVAGLSQVPTIGFSFGKLADGFALDARLSAGEQLGLTKVISAPKISTLDKREARISQGESIPFQTTSLQGTQTTFVDANLELNVTPQITSRDPNEPQKQILMKIRATRNAVGARSNPAGPSIDKREANTQVMVRDGETAVIGGIYTDEQINTVSGTPYLSRIPVLGWLFKNRSEQVTKKELLIFLTPFIIKS